MGPGVDDHGTGRGHPYLRRLDERDAARRRRGRRARSETAKLDPGGDPDAEVAALLAQIRLPLADVFVADQLERPVERLVVVAGIDDEPEVLGEGKFLRLDEVLAPDLDGVHLQLAR